METPLSFPFSLPVLSLPIVISSQALFILLALFFVVYAIISGVLVYHWSAYGMRSAGIVVAELLFLMVSIALFVFSILAIYYY